MTEATIETRKEALRQLHLDFFKELQETGLGFHPELRGQIYRTNIEIGIVKPTDSENLLVTIYKFTLS